MLLSQDGDKDRPELVENSQETRTAGYESDYAESRSPEGIARSEREGGKGTKTSSASVTTRERLSPEMAQETELFCKSALQSCNFEANTSIFIRW